MSPTFAQWHATELRYSVAGFLDAFAIIIVCEVILQKCVEKMRSVLLFVWEEAGEGRGLNR
jgi:hypothetical protein